MSELASRTGLLGELKRRYHEADIEGFGRIRCQSLTAKEAEALSCIVSGGFDKEKFASRKPLVIALCLVDEHDMRLFDDSDIDTIAGQDAALVDAIYEVCEDHINGERVTPKNLSETENGDSESVLLTAAAG